MVDFNKFIRTGLAVAFLGFAILWVLSGGMGSLVYRAVSDDESVNSILNGLVLENYDYISGKALFKNGDGQEIAYDPKNNGSVEYLTGYRVVNVGNDTVKLTPVDTDALYKVMPNMIINIIILKVRKNW